jgi:hypothetical protein
MTTDLFFGNVFVFALIIFGLVVALACTLVFALVFAPVVGLVFVLTIALGFVLTIALAFAVISAVTFALAVLLFDALAFGLVLVFALALRVVPAFAPKFFFLSPNAISFSLTFGCTLPCSQLETNVQLSHQPKLSAGHLSLSIQIFMIWVNTFQGLGSGGTYSSSRRRSGSQFSGMWGCRDASGAAEQNMIPPFMKLYYIRLSRHHYFQNPAPARHIALIKSSYLALQLFGLVGAKFLRGPASRLKYFAICLD